MCPTVAYNTGKLNIVHVCNVPTKYNTTSVRHITQFIHGTNYTNSGKKIVPFYDVPIIGCGHVNGTDVAHEMFLYIWGASWE